MRCLTRIVVAASTLSLLLAAGAWGEPGQTQSDRQGPVAVTLTPVSSLELGVPLKFKVSLNTHSGSLDAIAFERAVALRAADGSNVAPSAVEQAKGGGHHREAVIVFPPVTGGTDLRVVVKDIGGVAERSFVWPLAAAQ